MEGLRYPNRLPHLDLEADPEKNSYREFKEFTKIEYVQESLFFEHESMDMHTKSTYPI